MLLINRLRSIIFFGRKLATVEQIHRVAMKIRLGIETDEIVLQFFYL